MEKRVSEFESLVAGTGLAGGDCDHGGPLEPASFGNANPILAEWLSAVYRAVLEYLPEARRAGEDRDGGGFQRQPVDQYGGDAADAAAARAT